MHNTKQRIATAILLCAGFMLPVSVTAAQQMPVEKRSSAWDLLRKSRSKQTESTEIPTKERVVNFPKDRSLGQLYIQDAGSVRQLNYWFHWTDTGEAASQYLGEAQGEVHVPAGKRLFLTVRRTAWKDLSWLSKLGPDDLYGLGFSVLLAEPDKPSDRCMEHIAHLTGLRHLGLDRTDVTDKGFKYIGSLSSLEYLDLPYRVTDAGIDHIAKLAKLKCLHLFGCDNVTDKGLAKLAGIKSLTTLYVSDANITISGLAQLNLLSNLTTLRVYDLRRGGAILDLSGLANLEDLMLGFARKSGEVFTDADLVSLADLKRLTMVQIGPRDFTDKGIRHLARLPRIERLGVGGPRLTDEGLKFLSDMKTLNHLTIDDGNLTDRGLRYLEGLKLLEFLNVTSANAFSETAVQHLRNNLPNLHFCHVMP